MKRGTIILALATTFFVASNAVSTSGEERTAEYRSRQFAFRYPADCKLDLQQRAGTRIFLPSHSAYWRDEIAIRRHNKRTQECDVPQDCQPDNHDARKIAGRRAYAYSGEDAAMNRYVRRKGYFIEGKRFCWNFELTRTGRSYQKFDLPRQEMKRLDKASEIDAKQAKSAFNTVLKTFVLGPD